MSGDRATIWLGPALKGEREAARRRGLGLSLRLKQITERYHALLRRCEPEFSAAEWNILWAALNGIVMPGADEGEIPSASRMAAELHDWSINYGDENSPDVDLAALHQRVIALSPAQALAVIERIEAMTSEINSDGFGAFDD